MSLPEKIRHLTEKRALLSEFFEEADKDPRVVMLNEHEVLDEFNAAMADLETEIASARLKPSTSQPSATVAVIDTETTGLGSQDEPVSVAAIVYEVAMPSGVMIREIESYYELREPAVPIHPQAQAIHGLSLGVLHGRKLNADTLIRICYTVDVLVAHNAKFDRRMLRSLVPAIHTRTWACSMLALRDRWAPLPSRSLGAICDALDVARPKPHNALTDCRSLAEVLFKHSGSTTRSRTFMGLLVGKPWAPPDD